MQLINVDIVCRSGRRYNFDITPETTMPYGIWSRYTYVPPCRHDDEAEVRAQIMVLRFLRLAEDAYKQSCKKRSASKHMAKDPFAGTDYEDLPDFCDGVFSQLSACAQFLHYMITHSDRLAKYGVGVDDLKALRAQMSAHVSKMFELTDATHVVLRRDTWLGAQGQFGPQQLHEMDCAQEYAELTTGAHGFLTNSLIKQYSDIRSSGVCYSQMEDELHAACVRALKHGAAPREVADLNMIQ